MASKQQADPCGGLRHRKMVTEIDLASPTMEPISQELKEGPTLRETEVHFGQSSTVSPSRAKPNGAAMHVDRQGFKETSLTEPLLAGSDTGSSDEEMGSSTALVRSSSPDVVVKLVDEAWWQIALQVFIPYLIAGFGMVGAGIVLDVVQHYEVFMEVTEIFILVPALLGLKGNLEMTLASRLSTQANLGHMDTSKEQWSMIAGNLALTQVQAIVVGFLASLAAMMFGWIPAGKFSLPHAFLLCTSSVLTASFASLVLGTIMIMVVVFSRKCNINPDNVATPIAASLGDLTTLILLSSISSLLYHTLESHFWLSPVLLVIFLGLVPLWCVISHRNSYVNEVLYNGWSPVIGAMIISSIGGVILDSTVTTYDGIAVFQPVINGVGGNLVAVQASRQSTALHFTAEPGELPHDAIHGCPNPWRIFFAKDIGSRTARVLMFMVVPGHLVFMYTIYYMRAGHTSITPIFALVYLTAALIQVAILLYMSGWIVHYLWKKSKDPDNFSIPYLTAMGDLLGTGLLALAFHILYLIHDPSVVAVVSVDHSNVTADSWINTTTSATNTTTLAT